MIKFKTNYLNSLIVYLSCLLLLSIVSLNIARADSKFASTVSCSDAVKTCVSTGIREVEGFQVYRDCWDWSYVKTCNYPSKNDCRLYSHCYDAGDKGCLLKDSLGNCVNMQREFSCKSWNVINKENQTARMGFEEKPGKDGLVCKGIPCIDGHCVDKSYETNGEMMDSLSKLYATSNMNPDKDGNFNLFEGSNQHCTKKAIGYSNCCSETPQGWGKQIGAHCSKDEQTLMKVRSKNLCVYVGAEKKKKAGIHTLTKHKFCCFGNLLDKVIQVGGRAQLGKNFGSGASPDCRGLTLEEIQAIDWNKIDFGEFIEDLKVKFAGRPDLPSASELRGTIEGSMSSIDGYDADLSVAGTVDSESFDESTPSNLGGWSSNVQDDSWEAMEEKRILAERLEQERLARLEAERLEAIRLAEIEAERVRLEQERLKEIARKKEEVRLRELAAKRFILADKVEKKQRECDAAVLVELRLSERVSDALNRTNIDGWANYNSLTIKYNAYVEQTLRPMSQELRRLKDELARLR